MVHCLHESWNQSDYPCWMVWEHKIVHSWDIAYCDKSILWKALTVSLGNPTYSGIVLVRPSEVYNWDLVWNALWCNLLAFNRSLKFAQIKCTFQAFLDLRCKVQEQTHVPQINDLFPYPTLFSSHLGNLTSFGSHWKNTHIMNLPNDISRCDITLSAANVLAKCVLVANNPEY